MINEFVGYEQQQKNDKVAREYCKKHKLEYGGSIGINPIPVFNTDKQAHDVLKNHPDITMYRLK